MKKKHKTLLSIEAVVLVIAASVTIYSMLYAANWAIDVSTIAFVLWAISPYISFFAASRLFVKFAPTMGMAFPALVISMIMLVFTVYAYAATLMSSSSTAALSFVFVPIYLYIGSFFIMSVAMLMGRLYSRDRVD